MSYPNPYYSPLPNPFRLWTDQDDARLRLLAPIYATPEIAQLLDRTVTAVYARASVLGVSLMPPDPSSFDAFVWNRS